VTASGGGADGRSLPLSRQIALRDGDWPRFQRLVSEVRPPCPLAGRLTAAVDVQGSLQPPSVRTTGAGTIANLKVAMYISEKHRRLEAPAIN